MNIYEKNGYYSRKDYLISLAEEFDMDIENVFIVANLLGPSEDFDGLITAIEDFSPEIESYNIFNDG